MAGFILLMRFVKKLFSMTERQTYAGSWLSDYEFGKTGFEFGKIPAMGLHSFNRKNMRQTAKIAVHKKELDDLGVDLKTFAELSETIKSGFRFLLIIWDNLDSPMPSNN